MLTDTELADLFCRMQENYKTITHGLQWYNIFESYADQDERAHREAKAELGKDMRALLREAAYEILKAPLEET